MWVARNKNGIIWIFTEKPIRFETDGSWVSRVIPKTTYCSVSYHTKIGELNKKQFPELKWEDEPIQVELKEIISKDDI